MHADKGQSVTIAEKAMNPTSVDGIDDDSIAVITGGSSGMGLACAFRFGRHHRLVLADVNGERLEQAAAELRAAGCAVTPVVADVTKSDSIEKLVKTAQALGQFKILLHAAGLSPTMSSGKRIIEVNLIGTALVERAFLPLATPGTVAVLIASTAGHQFAHRNDPALRRPLSEHFWSEIAADCETPEIAYSVSKRGVIMYCEAVAKDWGAKGARIVTISPGLIETPMGRQEFAKQPLMQVMLDNTPLQRWGQAGDIALAAEFLTSEAASFITGSDLRIDGGITGLMNSQG
jgi:NAD(P)-dependent dehydrogenase (short-subunit alcohol dehydrogenase family)